LPLLKFQLSYKVSLLHPQEFMCDSLLGRAGNVTNYATNEPLLLIRLNKTAFLTTI